MSIIVRVISRLGPDWTAAIALSVQALIFLLQAVILYWQGRILRRHAATLEKQTEIAGVQANNAAKIGATLDKQERILDEQSNIMDRQLQFQQILEAKTERVTVANSLLDLNIQIDLLRNLLSSVSTYTNEMDAIAKEQWLKLPGLALQCIKEVQSSIQLGLDEKEYFLKYALDANKLRQSGSDYKKDLQELNGFVEKYKDFISRITAAAWTPQLLYVLRQRQQKP